MAAAADDAHAVDLSVIIPVYNERRKIAGDIRAAAEFCARHGLRGEILVADDGSDDGTPEEAEKALPAVVKAASMPLEAVPSPALNPAASRNFPAGAAELCILRLSPHRGKGRAVRAGMARSRGRLILFIDSGLCIPYDEITRGIELIESGACTIAHASRRLSSSRILRPQSLPRRLSAWLFRRLFTRMLGLPKELTDTQAGLKIYDGERGRALYRACASDGFLFDAEIILRAMHAEERICEFPVSWSADPDSRLQLRRMPVALVREACALKKRLHREFAL